MAYEEITALLGGWPGFELIGVVREPASAARPVPRIVLTLRAVPGAAKTCSHCGLQVAAVHDVTPREVRDLPILEAETWLVLPRARVHCPRCGPMVEQVPWLDRYQRMTTRLAEAIARLAQVLPLQHVAQWYHVGWDTVKQIDHRALQARLGPVTAASLAGVRVLAVDEFALRRGYRYATLVVDALTKRVLWVGRGSRREDLRPFFQLLGPPGCAAIDAVVMDMSGAFAEEVRAQCPRAVLVYDRFHVLAKYGREVIDRVRTDETNRLARAGGPDDERTRARRRVLKGARWLLLRNAATLTRPHDRLRLRELLQANRALFVVYVLKADLQQLWRFRAPWAVWRFWRAWCRRARASRIPALVRFARNLTARFEGIASHCRYPFNNGLLEGINNKIKVLKRMAYGFRDADYFFLKIRAAFPGIAG